MTDSEIAIAAALVRATPIAEPRRTSAYSTVSYAAFRVDTRTRPLRIGAQGSLKDALNAALPLCVHKDKLIIRETDELAGTTALHVYAIKKAAPKWIHPAGEIMPRRVMDLYAELVCVIDGEVLG